MESNKSLRKVTGVLCVLVLLLQLVSFSISSPFARATYLKNEVAESKEDIASYETTIAEYRSSIETCRQNIVAKEAELASAQSALSSAESRLSSAKSALTRANNTLDQVCTRSYYSSYWCDEECQPLHADVDAKDALVDSANDQVRECKNTVNSISNEIDYLYSDMSWYENQIPYLEEDIVAKQDYISYINGQLAQEAFSLVLEILGMILMLGGLALLAKVLFGAEENKKLLLIAVGVIAASALLQLLIPVFATAGGMVSVIGTGSHILLLDGNTYLLLIMALFAAVLTDKTTKPVAFRNAAIVIAVLSTPLNLLQGNVVSAVPFTAMLICLSFVIVPLVFTEYIKVAKHIFLSLITFGIWQLIWTYHVTKNLNKVEGAESRNPKNELLLCMFLPFFYPYWLYKTAELVELYGQGKSKVISLELLAIAFALICPLFSTVLIQNKINVIVGKPVEAAPAEEAAIEEAPAAEEAAEEPAEETV